MSWARLDDKAHSHPKFLGLDPGAIALWTLGLSYAASIEADGFIPRKQVPILAATFRARKRAFTLAALLVARRLWDDKGPDGYAVHDYLDYNKSKEQLRRERAANATRQGRARERDRVLDQVPERVPSGYLSGTQSSYLSRRYEANHLHDFVQPPTPERASRNGAPDPTRPITSGSKPRLDADRPEEGGNAFPPAEAAPPFAAIAGPTSNHGQSSNEDGADDFTVAMARAGEAVRKANPGLHDEDDGTLEAGR
jgi:hypothetical protein